MNMRYSSSYRAYSKDIPAFLVNRPREIVTSSMERMELARSIPKEDVIITDQTKGIFQVQSQSGSQIYNLHFGNKDGMPHCDCLDWMHRYLPCKHFFGVFQYYPDWQWNQLPIRYTCSPIITLDNQILQKFSGQQTNQTPVTPNVSNTMDENTSVNVGAEFGLSDESNTLPLPEKKKSNRSEAAKVREILSRLRSLTFLVQDSEALQQLHSALMEQMQEFEKFTSSEDGIDLETTKPKHSRKRSASPDQPDSTLPLPSHSKKHKYTGRVGEAATMMKAMYKVSKGVNDLLTTTNTKTKEKPYKADIEHCKEVHDSNNFEDGPGKVEEDEVKIIGEGIAIVPKRMKRKLHTDDLRMIKDGSMLTDNSINIAQYILHDQYPLVSGLEDTVLGPLYNFSVARGEFVQILHNSAMHWLCVSNIGCDESKTVNVYDSLNHGGHITTHVKKQVANILHLDDPQIEFNIKAVQQQDNGTDCGIYAVAYATSLLHGQDPEDIAYDTSKLRQHLLTCIHKGVLTPFPLIYSCVKRCKRKTVIVELFCTCRMPWHTSDNLIPSKQMAQCDVCANWYHRCCENIPPQIFNTHSYWQCSHCCGAS